MLIRQAVVSDASIVMNLRRQLVKENPKTYGVIYEIERRKKLVSYQNWIEEYTKPDSAMFLLFDGSDLVGMGTVRRNDPDEPEVGYFGSLGVLQKYQGKGLGTKLLESRLEWVAENTSFKKIKTIVTKSNVSMLKLAKKIGFKVVAEGQYRGTPEYYLEKMLQ